MAGKPIKNLPQESSSSSADEEEEEEDSQTRTQNTPQTTPLAGKPTKIPPKDQESSSPSAGDEQEDDNSGGDSVSDSDSDSAMAANKSQEANDSDADSDSDSGVAAKKSQEAIGTKMISKASAAGKRGRESNVAVKKKSKRAKGAVEEEETGVMGEESDVAVKKKSKRAKGAVEEEETAVEGEESDVAVKKKSKRAKGAVEEEETAVMGEESDVAVKKTSKRAKGAVEEEETAVKSENKKLFQRIFSEKDEIDLLKGITEYYESNGKDIMNDGFYEFIMNSVEVTVNRNQVADKVRRLKKKYANLAKRIEKGKDVSFAKAHDKISYELSKRIWGAKDGDDNMDDTKEALKLKLNLGDNDNKSKSGSGGGDGAGAGGMVDFNRMEETVLKDCMGLLTAEKRAAMETKLKLIELESYLQRSRLIRQLVKSTLQAYRSK